MPCCPISVYVPYITCPNHKKMVIETNINIRKWLNKYEEHYKRNGFYIEYIDNNVNKKEYSPTFESASAVFRRRGFLFKKEFISICEWKTTRQRNKYQENSEADIVKITTEVISMHPNIKEQIDRLTQLKGVGVPVASAILTAIFPKYYCVLDYRAWRALLWVMSAPFSFNNYREFSEIMDKFRNYASKESYMEYIKKVRKLAVAYSMTPRKIEEALWMYDKERGVL